MKSSQYLIVFLFTAGLFVACNGDDQKPADSHLPLQKDSTAESTDVPNIVITTPANGDDNSTTTNPDTSTTTKATTPTPETTTTPATTTTPETTTTTSTTPETTTTTSTTPSTTTTTTPAPITTPTPAPTTPTPAPTTPTPEPTTTTTTPAPITTTTPTPPIQPCRRFDGPSFIGGIVLTLGLLAIGMVGYKFYKAHNDRNYQTL